ncbi:hypothetical protein BB560_004803 [Smittium megazygosporum]|uniref:Uncharacterized protein n=1 Tax=Smittium megazygosporum TaxID=133381 RepID=A0A2T9Z8C4_9FUNG|nr:hypothetical protein BB560_004803 [Smittium megazygosporum]
MNFLHNLNFRGPKPPFYRRSRHNQSQGAKRDIETASRTQSRLSLEYLRQTQRRAAENADGTQLRRIQNAVRQSQHRANETPEQNLTRRAQIKARMRRNRANRSIGSHSDIWTTLITEMARIRSLSISLRIRVFNLVKFFKREISDLTAGDTTTDSSSPPWELKQNLDRRLSSAYLSSIENVLRRENPFFARFETLGSYQSRNAALFLDCRVESGEIGAELHSGSQTFDSVRNISIKISEINH